MEKNVLLSEAKHLTIRSRHADPDSYRERSISLFKIETSFIRSLVPRDDRSISVMLSKAKHLTIRSRHADPDSYRERSISLFKIETTFIRSLVPRDDRYTPVMLSEAKHLTNNNNTLIDEIPPSSG